MTTFANGFLVEKPRISSIDILRGVVMVIMALDHTRDFFHADAFLFDPTDLTKTSVPLFLTRWITHFCAPTFVFLAGTAICISSERKSKRELSVFLLTRGLWLIFLEVVVVRFSFFFNFSYDVTVFQVIWVIGASMIVMAVLIHFSNAIIILLGFIITVGHNLLDGLSFPSGTAGEWFGIFFYQSGFKNVSPGHAFWVPYPVLPWLGVMLLGYSAGHWYKKSVDPKKRQDLLLKTGLGAVILFVVLRFSNVYGDPAPWSVQSNGLFTVLSFLNCTKYPISLLYILMTLGPCLIFLSLLEKVSNQFFNPFIVFGRVPLFYYVIHFYIIHAGSLIGYMIASGKSFADLDFSFNAGFGGLPPGVGYSLFWVYVIWITIILILYPLCRWYNTYKSTHRQWWLSYV
ncbi:MAG: DUF1624 domain-containing protein [Cyclobacteriaceae bacterium]|nr:DUF1624 domain-containing protein [Cyclobacteriaceae bacterium]